MKLFYSAAVLSFTVVIGVSCSTPRDFMVQRAAEIENVILPATTPVILEVETPPSEAKENPEPLIAQIETVESPSSDAFLPTVQRIESELPAEVEEVISLNKLPDFVQVDSEESTLED